MACWKLIAANDARLSVEWAAVSSTLSTSLEGEKWHPFELAIPLHRISCCGHPRPKHHALSDMVARAQRKGGHVDRRGLMPCPIVR